MKEPPTAVGGICGNLITGLHHTSLPLLAKSVTFAHQDKEILVKRDFLGKALFGPTLFSTHNQDQ